MYDGQKVHKLDGVRQLYSDHSIESDRELRYQISLKASMVMKNHK